jgi:polyhydroxyalkanoate synthesis regulator phasin
VDPDADPIEYVAPEPKRMTLTQRVEQLERRVADLEAAADVPEGQIEFNF